MKKTLSPPFPALLLPLALLLFAACGEEGGLPFGTPDAAAPDAALEPDTAPPVIEPTGPRDCDPGEVPTTYRVRDLGTFSRDNSGLANAIAINGLGHVVGVAEKRFADRPSRETHAFVWFGDNEQIQHIPGGDDLTPTRGNDINDAGELVGSANQLYEDGHTESTGFYWNGEDPVVPVPELSGFIEARAINDDGWVVGGDREGAFVWNARTGEMIARGLGLPRAERSTSVFNDINAAGLAVGQSRDASDSVRPIFWTAEAGLQPLPVVDGTEYADARGVNARGSIAVEASGATSPRCYLYRSGAYDTPEDIGVLDSQFEIDSCRVEGINVHDAVVGSDSASAFTGVSTRAWVYIDGMKLDLTDMLPPHSWQRWQLTTAIDINDDGVVVGIGIYDDIPGRAFVATPVCGRASEPPTAPPLPPPPSLGAYCRAETYTLEPLTLGERATGAVAYAVDERGRAVGETLVRGGTHVATMWLDGGAWNLDGSGLDIGREAAYDINDEGVVVGFGIYRYSETELAPRSFSWSLGDEVIDTYERFEPSRFWAVDAMGRAAGVVGRELAFYTPTRGLRRLEYLVGPSYESTGPILAMNDVGDMVGAYWVESRRTPFVWNEAMAMRALPLATADEGEAHGANDAGVIVGSTWIARGPRLPVSWASAEAEPLVLDLLPGTTVGEARAINAEGEIVGWDGNGPDHEDGEAWIHRDGEKTALDVLVDAPGWVLRVAYDVSDAGQIVGYGELDGEGPLPFILTPVCE